MASTDMFLFYISLFLISCFFLYFSSSRIVSSLTRIAKFLGWREFVVAFFVMSFASSLPNLFVGIASVLHKIPQLSFGEIVGGNILDLTLVIGLAVLFAKDGVPTDSRMVQKSSLFTLGAAILPLILISDGILSRQDGILLIAFFLFYMGWLFSKKERFTKIYDDYQPPPLKGFKIFLKDSGRIILGIIILLAASEGIVVSAKFFAKTLNFPIALIGILIVGLGNVLPETFFTITSAKKGETWMILGNLMGSVVVPATLILAIVSLISPITISDFSPFVIARFFLVIASIFFLIFTRTERKITKKEALFLFLIYIIFILTEILTKI